MEEYNQRIASYREVSEALGKKLIKLYGERVFPRQGKIFADMLFQSGIEAGTYIASLADIEERNVKIKLATNAMVKLNQADYLIDVMREAKYYNAVQVMELDEFLQRLIAAMRDLLNSAYAQLRAEGKQRAALAEAKAAAAVPPTPSVQPKAQVKHTHPPKETQPKEAQPKAPQPKVQAKPPQPKVNPDPDGFLIPAEGEANAATEALANATDAAANGSTDK